MKKILLSVFVLSVLLPTLAFASFDINLKYGSKGQSVIELQDFLQDQGVLTAKSSGYYGLSTLKAVKAFQITQNITPASGYFGSLTRAKANSLLLVALSDSNTAEKKETGINTIIPTSTEINPVVSATNSLVAGCILTSVYNSNTGQLCNNSTRPSTPNFPVGCISKNGYSTTTGKICSNTVESVLNTSTTTINDVCNNIEGIQSIAPSGMYIDKTNCLPINAPTQNENSIPVIVNPTLPIVETQPVSTSKRDLQIINLTTGDVLVGSQLSGCFTFKVTPLDNNGNEVANSYPMQMISSKLPNQKSFFGGGGDKNMITYCPDEAGDSTLTFSFSPLNMVKTVTVNAKTFTPTPPVITFEQGLNNVLGKLKIAVSDEAYSVESINYEIISSDMSIGDIPISTLGITSMGGSYSMVSTGGFFEGFNNQSFNRNPSQTISFNVGQVSKKGSFIFKLTSIKINDMNSGNIITIPLDYSSQMVTYN